MKTTGWSGLGVLLVLGLHAQWVSAQPASPPHAPSKGGDSAQPAEAPTGSDKAAPAPVAAVDIVELTNGAMYRGTISEKVPGDHVEIVLITGVTKTFPMSDVKYAGPAADRPASAPAPAPAPAPTPAQPQGEGAKPMVTLHANEASLHVVANRPGITVYRKSGAAVARGPGGTAVATGYDTVCTAPCDVSMPAGIHDFAVARGDGTPVEAGQLQLPEGSSRLVADYKSRTGLRVAGWIIFGSSLFIGGYLIATDHYDEANCDSYTGDCTTDTKTDSTKEAVGILVLGAGGVTGLVMALTGDKSTVTVIPLEQALSPHPSFANPGLDRGVASLTAPGLGVSAHF